MRSLARTPAIRICGKLPPESTSASEKRPPRRSFCKSASTTARVATFSSFSAIASSDPTRLRPARSSISSSCEKPSALTRTAREPKRIVATDFTGCAMNTDSPRDSTSRRASASAAASMRKSTTSPLAINALTWKIMTLSLFSCFADRPLRRCPPARRPCPGKPDRSHRARRESCRQRAGPMDPSAVPSSDKGLPSAARWPAS